MDTVIQQLQHPIVNADSVQQAKEIADQAIEDNQASLVLHTSLVTTIMAQFIIAFFSYERAAITRREKKALLWIDLKTKREIIVRLIAEYKVLQLKFQKRQADQDTYNSFNDLHTDVYDSITKHELFLMFGVSVNDIIEIYNSFKFLKENDVGVVYRAYIEKIGALMHHILENVLEKLKLKKVIVSGNQR